MATAIVIARRKSKSSSHSNRTDPSPYLDRLFSNLIRRANLLRKKSGRRVK